VVGNVSERCADRYDPSYYAEAPENDPPGPSSGESRVARGSSWSQVPAVLAHRYVVSLSSRYDRLGFRVACDVEPAPKRP